MNFKKNEKYISIAIYSFLVISMSILFYLVMSEVNGVMGHIKAFIAVFTPIIIGFVMAYLFNFILVLYEEKVLNSLKIKKSFRRFLSLVLTYITVGILFILFLQFILPQLISSLVGLVNDIPSHVRDISKWFDDMSKNFEFNDQINLIIVEQFNKMTNYIVNLASNLLPLIGNLTKSLLSSVSNIILGLIISIYVLMDKERFTAQSKKMIAALLPKKGAAKTIELAERADSIFGSFLSGKILDSLIVAILTFFVLTFFKMPYILLVSFIIGVSNIIPFFGPFIGAIPSFFIILFVSPQQAVIFLVIILVIQQIDGNIIGPKILGDSLGISPFWILFSLLVSGKIFGFVGLIIGVPLFVFVYSIIKELTEFRLAQKGLPTKTNDYKK